MSTTLDLTQRHRAQQLLLRKSTTDQMARLWPALDWARLDATYPAFAVQVGRMVQTNRATSAGLASQYLRAFRQASGLPGDLKVVFAQPMIVDQFNTSLRVTSVVAAKTAAGQGVAGDVAMSNALTEASGAMSRMVLNGGRETAMATIAADARATGWVRVVGGSACKFCTMLSGRVYGKTAQDFASHDNCGCSMQPTYRGRSSGDAVKVKDYSPTDRRISDADRARTRAWIAANL